ncbi:MAG: MarR family winged helix-turn-helix transcriptional regulator [Caulobacteraceae bacterium]
MPAAGLSRAQYAAIADFRHELKRFLVFSTSAASAAGLPSQQHQALLAIAGSEERLSVGALADRLLVAPHSSAELVTRMIDAGLVEKSTAPDDRRRMLVALTPKAEALLGELTAAHLEELVRLEPALAAALRRLSALRPK